MGERNLTRGSGGATANDRNGTRGMVRCAKGAFDELKPQFDTREGMNFGDGNLLFKRRRRQETSGNAGEQSFSGARRSRDEKIVMAGESDDKGALGEGLAADLVKVIISGR